MSAEVNLASSQSSLCIGGTVLFLVSSRDRNGYIYSELTSSSYNFLTVFPIRQGSEVEPNFPNIAYATFRVLAPNKYKAKQYFEKLKNQIALTGTQRSTSIDELQPSHDQLSHAKKAAEAEEKENAQEQERRFGAKVLYGDFIQLQHIASGKYVTVQSEASKTESNNLLVNLFDSNSDGCMFKILPRYKVRSEGDEIRFGDQMKLESVKTQGQFLHCSAGHRVLGKSGFHANPNFSELNLSATESAITLIPHYCHIPSTKHSEKALRAGDCIRLFHREDECYIVAEGSFAEQEPVHENIHCRQRRVDQRKRSHPSTSANTYWQIEKEEDPRTGEVLSWGERCRIKHLPTRRYLAVCMTESDTWQVTLKAKTPGESDLDTLFSFHPLIEEGIEVLLESYARIQHLLSKQWLHLEKKEYVRKNFNPNAEGLAGLQWDSAELYMLSTSKDMGDYDAFTLQEVSDDLLKRFNYVAGIVPILSTHIDVIHTNNGALTQKQANFVTEALKELGDWMVTDNDRDTKNNQKLLRNLRVLEQLTEILKSSQELVSSYFHTAIARECYNVIKKYLEGDSRKNENYLARFIEFFQTQVRKGLNAEEVLVEIVQDNLTIVTRMANTRMEDMINQFRTTKDPRFLHFLSSLCVCSGRPIPSTQNRLLNDLVLRYGRELFLKTSLRKNSSGQNEVFYFRPGSVDAINIHSLKCPTNNTGTHHQHHRTDNAEKDFEVLEAQLHLFGKLCKGNNKGCINFLVHPSNRDGYISFEEALLCAQDTELNTTLRSHYVELLLVMFVDVGANRPFLDHLCYSFIYQDLIADPYSDTGDDETVALTGVENVHFPKLKEWLLNVVKSFKVLIYDDAHSEENELLALMLDVLGHLVRYGYYDSEDDIDEIVTPLIELLNGENDLPCVSENNDMEEFQSIGRKEGNRAIFAVKRKSLEVMELFFRFKFYVKLQKFIFDFKVLDGAGRMSVGNQSKKSGHSPPSNLRTLKANINPDLCQDWLHSEDMIRTVRDRLQYLCDGAIKGINGEDNPVLERVLIDLSTYDCDELVTSSLDLLTQMYFFEEELFNKAQQSQLIISEISIADYEKVNCDILPELRQLLRVDPNQNDQQRMIELLDQLCKLCVLSTDTDDPNKQNQIMLNNFGVLDDILSYVLSKGDQGTQLLPGSEVTVQLEVFQKCFCLLRFLTADLKNIQQRLFNRINDLLAVKVPTIALADLADLLTEVFTGGPELILKVSEAHLEKIFEIIIDCKDPTVQAQFMVTLDSMAKIEELNLPVKRNQALIVKNFCRYRDRICQDILGETKSLEEKRMNILLMPDRDPPDPQLQLLLSLTDLLAACAEGKNLFIESVCQNIFSVEELINIMSSELPPMRKRPFVRFLIEVYMYTERDKQTAGVTTISHGGVMWSYLEHLAELLKDIAIAVHSIVSEDVEPLCRELKSTRRKRALSQVGKLPLSRTKSKRVVPSVTGDEGHLKPGLIEYLIEGVLPLLHIFYSSHFDPLSILNEEQRKMEYNVSAQIAKNLITLKNELSKYFFSQQNVVMFQETILSLSSHEEIRRIANLDKKVEATSIISTDSVDRIRVNQHSHSKHRRHQDPIQSIPLKPISYIEVLREESEVLDTVVDLELQPSVELVEYKDQEKINDSFHTFARNYQLIYVGPNTATHQIGSSVPEDIEYSEKGEDLPLGPNFQQLLKLYYSYSNEQPVRNEVEMFLKQLEISTSQTEQLNETEQISQDILDIRCLQVLRALIHNRIKLIDPELKDRDPVKYRSKSDDLYVPVQNAIQAFRGNAIQKIIPLLCHPNESISRESLALMKALLFSGNEQVQEGLAINVQETREETLFLILKKRLETASLNYKETRDLQLLLSTRQDYQLTSLKSRQEDVNNSLTRSTKYDSAVELNISGQVRFSCGQSQDIAITLEPPDESSQATSRLRADFSEQPKGNASSEQLLLSSQILANDSNWTTIVLEVIGLMCDGQHRTLQDYLRVQPDNFKTVNVVAEVTAFLHTYTSDIGRENMGQIHQILQSLIEMCVGNVHNQQVIYDKLVIEPLNRLLQLPWKNVYGHNHNDYQHQQQCQQCSYLLDLVRVKGSAVELLDAMLEETSPQTSIIAQGIGSSLDMESVIDTKKFFHVLQSHPLIMRKQMDDDCQRGMFRAYHIVVSLMEYQAISLTNQDDFKDTVDAIHGTKDVYNECTKHSRTIEIHYEEGSKPMLARVHFPYNPDDKLREEVTEVVRWNINRDSMEDKQRALLDLMPALKRDVLHQMKLRELKFLKPVLIFHTYRYRLLILLTLLLNLFILFLGNVPRDPSDIIVPDFPIWFKPYVLYILGTVHLLLSIWAIVEYFIINWPHFKLPRFCYSIWKSIRKCLHGRRSSSEYSIPQSTCLDVGIFGMTTVYMIIFLLSSILSLIFSGYFYCICLLYIIYNNDILQRVLRAVTKNGISLIWVAILGLCFLFIYAVISFAFLHTDFVVTDNAALYCDTLSQCMYSVLRYGLIDNIGLLVPLNSTGPAPAFSAGVQVTRLLFDLSFFIIIITIGLNIVFGIIVDTFSELREERGNVEADQKSTCFICDLPSHQFERKAKGFKSHVKHDHNMWNYVYYSLYLDNIDTGDHNAIQKYVYELIDEKSTSFFPQEEARCLFDEEDATGLLIEELMNKMDYIVQHFRDKEHTKSVIAKKEKQKKWEEQVLKNRQDSFVRDFSLDSDRP